MSVLSEIGRIQSIKDKLVLSLQRLGYNIDNKLLINNFAKIIDPFTNGESLSYLEKDQNYLTFKWVQNGAFYWKTSDASWTKDIQYKKNGTGEWITITSSTSGYVCDCITGDEIWVKGNNTTYASANYYCSFKIIGKTYISGNVNSLLNFNTILTDYCFRYLFYNCSFIDIDKEHPLLLPATTLANYCYSIMFRGCTSLTTTPALPATALVSGCYCQMFYGCRSLTTAPELPATTLTFSCYQNMFFGCTSLNYIKCLATDIFATYCTSNWVQNVASSGTFVKNASMTSWTAGTSGIPSGWTVEDAS